MDEPQRLSYDLQAMLHRREITLKQAWDVQRQRQSYGRASKRLIGKCDNKRVRDAYEMLLKKADAFPGFADILQLHLDTVESKSHLSPCFKARKRCDLIYEARLEGMVLPFNTRCLPRVSRLLYVTSPETATAYVIGKGPSIDTLSVRDFEDPDAPVLCINESIRVVERLGLPNPLFAIAQDTRVVPRTESKKSHRFLSYYAWKNAKVGRCGNTTVYFPEEIGGREHSLTVNQCVRILARAGFTEVVFYGFDACVNGDCGYAKSLGVEPDEWNHKVNRFRGYYKEIYAECAVKKMKYALRMPRGMWNVICVLRKGGIYADYHVEWLRKQVEKHVKTPHRFVCINDAGVPGQPELVHDWPGWWSKVEMFDGFRFNGYNLYLDLDTVINRDITLPETLEPGVVYGQPDQIRKPQLYGAVLMWDGDACQLIYETMLADPAGTMQKYKVCGDQALVSDVMKGRTKRISFDMRSFKNRKDHRDGDIILFHGNPRPWNVKKDYVPRIRYRSLHVWLHHLISTSGFTRYWQLGEGEELLYLLRNWYGLKAWASFVIEDGFTDRLFSGVPDEVDVVFSREACDIRSALSRLAVGGIFVGQNDGRQSLMDYCKKNDLRCFAGPCDCRYWRKDS